MKFEKRGKVSLWLIRSGANDFDQDFLSTQFGIDDYYDEMLEVGGSEQWDPISLSDAFLPMSYSESWAEAAIEAARALDVTECRRVILILNFSYAPGQLNLPADPLFLGVFDYK